MTSSRLAQLIEHIYRRDSAAVKRAVQLLPRLVHCKHSKDDRTPLHVAAAVGCLASLKELLTAGASCTAVDAAGDTPLHVAASQGHLALVKELTADAGRRCCLKVVNKQGATPLHLAAAAGHTGVAQHLMSVGAKLQARDKAGRTPWELVHPEDDAMRACLGHTSTSTRPPGASLISPGASGRSASRRSNHLHHLHHPHGRGASPSAGSLASPVSSSACSTPARGAGKRGARPAAVAAAVRLSASNPFLAPEVAAAATAAAAVSAPGVTGTGAPGATEADAARQQDQEVNGNPFRDPTPAPNPFHEAAAPNPFHSTPFPGPPAAAAGGGASAGFLQRRDSVEESMEEVPLSPRKRSAAAAAAAGSVGSGVVNGHYVALTVAALEQHQRSLAAGHSHHPLPGALSAPTRQVSKDGPPAAPGAPVVLPPHKPVVQNSPWADLGVRVSQCGMSRLPQGPLVSQGSYGALQRQELQQPLTAGSTALLRGASFKGSPLAAVDAGGLKPAPAAGPGSIAGGEAAAATGGVVSAGSLARRSLLHTGSLGGAAGGGAAAHHTSAAGAGAAGGGGNSSGVNPYSIYSEPMPLREMSAKVLELEAAAAGTAAKAEQWDGVVEALPVIEKSASELADRVSQQEVLGLQLEEAVEGLAGRLTDTEGALDTVKRRHEEATERVDGLQLSLLQRLALVGAEQQNLWSSVNHIKEQLGVLQEQQAATAATLAASGPSATAAGSAAAARSPSPAVLSPTGSMAGVRGAALGLEVAAAVAAAVRPLQEQLAAMRGEVDVLMASRKAPSAEASALRTSFAHFSAAAAARGSDSPEAAAVAGAGGGGQAPAGGVGDESLVAFMDTTSRCLMDQETALAELQASTQAAERRSAAQLEELRQEVAVAQTALGLLGQSLGPGTNRPGQGPLSSAHNATSQMTLATNLVKIQTHMSQLEASFAALQAGHQEACDERQALQAAWREEVERQAAAAAAAADALAQREAEWQGREERLQQLRVAVLAEESARRELLEVEAGLAGAVKGALAGQEDLGRQVEALRDQAAHMNEIFMCEMHQINDKVDQVAHQLDAASAQVAAEMAALKAAPVLAPVRPPSADLAAAAAGGVRLARSSPGPGAGLVGSRPPSAAAARSPLPLPLPLPSSAATGRGSRPASRASPALEGGPSVTSITSGGGSSVQSAGQVLLPGRSQLSCALSSGPSSEAAAGLGALPRPGSRGEVFQGRAGSRNSMAAGAAAPAPAAGGQGVEDVPSLGDVGQPQGLDQYGLGTGDTRVTFGDTPVTGGRRVAAASPNSAASPAAGGRLTPADYYLHGPVPPGGLVASPCGDGGCDLAPGSPGDRDAGQQKRGGYMRMTPSKSGGGSASKWLSHMTPGRSSSKRKQAAREAAAAAAEGGEEYVGLAAGGGGGGTRQVRPGDVPQCGCAVM